ncbi:MAG: hypothetical protein RIR72_389, partial [Actinomycetota bacterium]
MSFAANNAARLAIKDANHGRPCHMVVIAGHAAS